jgi:hypothetical protein
MLISNSTRSYDTAATTTKPYPSLKSHVSSCTKIGLELFKLLRASQPMPDFAFKLGTTIPPKRRFLGKQKVHRQPTKRAK